MKNLKPFLRCFGIILMIELIVVSNLDWWQFRIITKPMVVGALLVFCLMQKTDKKTRVLVTTALLFSLMGDVQLIYAGEYESLFIGGLLAFLMAHIMYIIQFSRTRNKNVGFFFPIIGFISLCRLDILVFK